MMFDPFENLNAEIDFEIFAALEMYAQICGYTIWVWSSGLEEWEKGWMSFEDRGLLTYSHSKTVFGVTIHIYRDLLGRYVTLHTM